MRTLLSRVRLVCLLPALLFCLCAHTATAQKLLAISNNSKVRFQVVNHVLGSSTVEGSLGGLRGSISFNPNRIKESFFDVTVSIGTIKTGIGLRDRHLKKADYFNEPRYPLARVKSLNVTHSNRVGIYILQGQLTLKGVTQNIEIPFTAQPVGKGWLFKGQFRLNRLDYGVGPDNSIDDTVTVLLEVQAF